MTNTPSASPEPSAISADDRDTLQDIINKLEWNSPKSGMAIYIDAAYQFIKKGNPDNNTVLILRTIKKGLDDGNPKYTREYIMVYLGITISERENTIENVVDIYKVAREKIAKMSRKPRESVNNTLATSTSKDKSQLTKKTYRTSEKEVLEDEDTLTWVPDQKWERIIAPPQEVVAKISEIQKTPEEIEKYDALIVYLKEEIIPEYQVYLPYIMDISFDKYGYPIILQVYRRRLSRLDQGIANLVLDKIGDFIFKKAT